MAQKWSWKWPKNGPKISTVNNPNKRDGSVVQYCIPWTTSWVTRDSWSKLPPIWDLGRLPIKNRSGNLWTVIVSHRSRGMKFATLQKCASIPCKLQDRKLFVFTTPPLLTALSQRFDCPELAFFVMRLQVCSAGDNQRFIQWMNLPIHPTGLA